MPRKAQLANHLTSEELKEKYRKSQDPVEARRWHLLWKISLGWSIKNGAVAVGMNYDYARKIVRRYNNQGEQGLENRRKRPQNHARGKQPLLNEEQVELLKKELQGKAPDGGIWTGPKVARWIEKETGKEKVWNQRGWDYLRRYGYS